MINKFLCIGLAFCVSSSLSIANDASEQLNSQIQGIEKRLDSNDRNSKQLHETTIELKKQIKEISLDRKAVQQRLNEFSAKISALENRQNEVTEKQESLGASQIKLINSIDQLSQDTKDKTRTIDEKISSRSMVYGVAIVAILMLVLGCYWYLRRHNDMSEQTLIAQVNSVIHNVRSTEENIAKSDLTLADSLLEILSKLKLQEMSSAPTNQGKSLEPDHHLPLKLADEIHRMRKRLASLPEDTKGLTPLQKSLERLESALAEQGYEIVDHTGMVYTDNLSVKARLVPSDDLGPDQKIISKVVAPQVNYSGVMIRMADIEVSIGS